MNIRGQIIFLYKRILKDKWIARFTSKIIPDIIMIHLGNERNLIRIRLFPFMTKEISK